MWGGLNWTTWDQSFVVKFVVLILAMQTLTTITQNLEAITRLDRPDKSPHFGSTSMRFVLEYFEQHSVFSDYHTTRGRRITFLCVPTSLHGHSADGLSFWT